MSLGGSELRGTSSAERTWDARTTAAMRRAAAPVGKPRKPARPELREVTSGIVCFCGERFGEAQALAFMLHLRAEVGEVLEWSEKQRARRREEIRQRRERRNSDPEYRAEVNAYKREQSRQLRADPEYRAVVNERRRQKYAADPEYRARDARRKAARKAAARAQCITATCAICGNEFEKTRISTSRTCSRQCAWRLRSVSPPTGESSFPSLPSLTERPCW